MRDGVKCPSFRSFGRLRLLACLVSALVGVFAREAGAQLLFGGGPRPPREPAPLDPRLPRGALQVDPPRPQDTAGPPACSFRVPVCVHAGPKTTEKQALEWLAALETAYERLVYSLRLPAPREDGELGGGPALDVYLLREGGGEPGGIRAYIDAPSPTAHFDTASVYCVASPEAGERERAATLCVGEAIAARLDASETPFSRRAMATELWLSLGTPTSSDALLVDDAQAAPERAVVGRDLGPSAEGGVLLLDYLDTTRGRGDPGGPALATYALSAGPKSPVAWRFTNEPDTMDVLRTTFGPKPSDVARFFADFAVARAFIGSRDVRDATVTWPSLEWTGDLGRIRFEWRVPLGSLPRTLAPSRPIEPTGSTYLFVDFDTPATDARDLAFQADWEPPGAFRWVVILVDKAGHIVRRLDVPFLERETHVERIVGDLSGAAAAIIVGTNLGGLGPSYPFDPDFEPFESHGYVVSLSRQ